MDDQTGWTPDEQDWLFRERDAEDVQAHESNMFAATKELAVAARYVLGALATQCTHMARKFESRGEAWWDMAAAAQEMRRQLVDLGHRIDEEGKELGIQVLPPG